jgi:hypothetical protein
MEFRLAYRGHLPSETGSPRLKDKFRIRSVLHPQLRELWASHRILKELQKDLPQSTKLPHGYLEALAEDHKFVSKSNHIHRFAPLVTKDNYHGCALDILFLRRDMPGGIVKYGGDIDNRLKVLFDALRHPKEAQEIEDIPQPPDENPCYCLLEDDQYIDQVSVTTDRLLTPPEGTESVNDVVLVIHVTIGMFDPRVHFAPV